MLVVSCWLLVVSCWLLVVGCWLLVVGCWLRIKIIGIGSSHQGCSKGLEPIPLGSQPSVQNLYTTGTIIESRVEGLGSRAKTAYSSGLRPRRSTLDTQLFSSPTRIRTRNTSLEARDDVRFTIGLWEQSRAESRGSRVQDFLPSTLDPSPSTLSGSLLSALCSLFSALPSGRCGN